MPANIVKGFRLALLAGVSALAATAAHAQEEAVAAAPPEAAEVEELVVVGSQIRGAQVTGVLPVTVLDAEAIEATGATSGDELFRAIPQAGDVAFNESRDEGGQNDARGDTASINLRGLGTGNTLVLLNGRRMVPHPGTQTENLVPVQTVNTNAIPVMGVRRIEVLRDGAAAIYGTDAVAGVINTVLKSSFDGFTFEVEAGMAEGTDMQEYQGSFEWGKDFNGGRSNISLFGQFTMRDPLYARERDYAREADLRPLVKGTIFENDADFNGSSTVTPWGEFIRLNATTFAPAGLTTGVNPTGATGAGTALTSSAGSFHVQPDYNPGCIVPGQPGVCYDNSTLATLSDDANLRYNDNYERTIWGETDRYNLFAFFNHEFDNGMEFYAETGVYYSDYLGVREQDAPLAATRIIIPANAYWNPLGPSTSPNRIPFLKSGAALTTNFASGGAPLQLQDYRPIDAGPQYVDVQNVTTRYLAGLRGEWRNFDWDSAFVYSKATTDDTMTGISNTAFQASIGGTTAEAYNPFNGGSLTNPSSQDAPDGNEAAIRSFLIDVTRKSETTLAMWDFKVSNNNVFTLPAGPVGMAAGVELRRETFEDDRDDRLDGTITFTNIAGEFSQSDVMGVSATPDTTGSRNVQSVFVELAVPLVSPDMNIPAVRSIDLQLAARHENYTTFGSVTKPKVALAWRVVPALMFRASWSEGFRAPNLPQLFESGVQRSNTRTDLIKCEAQVRTGAITQFEGQCLDASQGVVSVRSGSQDLEPEESENLTYGVVFNTDIIDRRFGHLTVTADYWRVEQTNVIGIFSDSNAIALDYLLRVNGSSNPNVLRADPTPDEVAMFAGSGLDPVGRINQVIDNYVNLTPRTVEGADFGVFYRLSDTPWGSFNWAFNAAKLLTFYQEPSEDAARIIAAQGKTISNQFNVVGAESLIEQNGRPEWRMTSSITWRKGGWGAGLWSSYVGGVDDTSVLHDVTGDVWRVKPFRTHNVYAQYTFRTDNHLDGARVRLGVRNIGDEDPPLADETFGYMGDLHSPRGRWWYASVRKRF